jgi:hypothetical protein
MIPGVRKLERHVVRVVSGFMKDQPGSLDRHDPSRYDQRADETVAVSEIPGTET